MKAGMRASDPRELLLRHRLGAARAAIPPCHAHPDAEVLAAHAAAELPPEQSDAVNRHLAACADARCLGTLRRAAASEAAAHDALYTVRREEHTDPKVSLPHRQAAHAFECDGALWEAFEALAREEGCSTDYLINEAMRALAQQRQRSARLAGDPATYPPGAPREVTVRHAPSDPPPAPQAAPYPRAPSSRDYPRERNTPTLPRAYLPRAPASSRRSPVPPPASARGLAVVVAGRTYAIDKDRFVVGRGGIASDLAIDDIAVSRQHALIEHASDGYWLVDMGSTNGIEYQGERIARRRIAHGDRYRIGDHELEFLLS